MTGNRNPENWRSVVAMVATVNDFLAARLICRTLSPRRQSPRRENRSPWLPGRLRVTTGTQRISPGISFEIYGVELCAGRWRGVIQRGIGVQSRRKLGSRCHADFAGCDRYSGCRSGHHEGECGDRNAVSCGRQQADGSGLGRLLDRAHGPTAMRHRTGHVHGSRLGCVRHGRVRRTLRAHHPQPVQRQRDQQHESGKSA